MAEAKQKSPSAFRTISEASDELNVPQHVLRFWETKFSQIRPLKRGGRRRYYRPEDLALLVSIRDLLYDKGYTIKGVQRLLKEGAAGRKVSADETENQDHLPAAALPKLQTSVPATSKPLKPADKRYSPFSRDDIIAAQDSPDAITFSPSRATLQSSIVELRQLQIRMRNLAQAAS
ncbi:MAG: MerR family transcriptional regulator [Alphaproteobacteria bacterium]